MKTFNERFDEELLLENRNRTNEYCDAGEAKQFIQKEIDEVLEEIEKEKEYYYDHMKFDMAKGVDIAKQITNKRFKGE